jgi:hypothetical protein
MNYVVDNFTSYLKPAPAPSPSGQITFGNKSQRADFFAEEHLPVGAVQGAYAFCSFVEEHLPVSAYFLGQKEKERIICKFLREKLTMFFYSTLINSKC